MVEKSVLLPCAILGGVVGVMLIFIWWFFPRTWIKGNKQEFNDITMSVGVGDENGLTQSERLQIVGQHAKEYIQAMEARNKARAEGKELKEPAPVYQPFGVARGNAPPSAVG